MSYAWAYLEWTSIITALALERNDHCTHPEQDWCDCDWCRFLVTKKEADNEHS